MKVRIPAAALACASALALIAAPAGAALKKYKMTIRNITNSPNVTPNPDIATPRVTQNFHTSLVDNAAGPSPVLTKFVRAGDATITTLVPSLATTIFVSNNFREGPGVTLQVHGQDPPPFTGTGSTSTNIRWGTVTGWTITGSFWCNSNPGIICSLAMGVDEDTADPRFNSEFYDLGTWTFHGTGFTGVPFISSYNTNTFGNTAMWVRGATDQDATVPALPLIGTALLGGSLALGGFTALRRRRKS